MKQLKRVRVSESQKAHSKAFIDLLKEASRHDGHHRLSHTLTTFLDMSFRAVRGQLFHPGTQAWRENEDRFEATASRLSERALVTELFAKMLGHMQLAMHLEPKDFIGPIFSEIATSAELGQFFTPPEVSELIARVTLADMPAKIADPSRTGPIALLEPTCGVGGMILAATNVMRELQCDIARDIHWTGVELDYRAMCAAYLQCAAAGIPATIYWGNSLTLDISLVTPTPAALLQRRPMLAIAAE